MSWNKSSDYNNMHGATIKIVHSCFVQLKYGLKAAWRWLLWVETCCCKA